MIQSQGACEKGVCITIESYEGRKKRDTHEADDDTSDGSIPRSKRLNFRSIRQFRAVEPLLLEALMEPNIGHRDTEPGHKTGNCYPTQHKVLSVFDGHKQKGKNRFGLGRSRTGHVGEPSEDLARTTVDTHVCQGGEQGTEDD